MLKVTVIDDARVAAILTGNYVFISPVKCEPYDNVIVGLNLVVGNLASVELVIEYSHDATGSNWYRSAFVADPSGAVRAVTSDPMQITTGGMFSIPIQPIDMWFRVGIKGTGDATGSTAEIDLSLSAS